MLHESFMIVTSAVVGRALIYAVMHCGITVQHTTVITTTSAGTAFPPAHHAPQVESPAHPSSLRARRGNRRPWTREEIINLAQLGVFLTKLANDLVSCPDLVFGFFELFVVLRWGQVCTKTLQ